MAPRAALPIKVNTTRRERFMMFPLLREIRRMSPMAGRSSKAKAVISRHRAGFQLRPEKPKACANPPKPPRLTLPDSEVPEDELWLDESPPPKKLKCAERL